MRQWAKWYGDLLDWYDCGGYIVCGAVYGLVYFCLLGGPLN